MTRRATPYSSEWFEARAAGAYRSAAAALPVVVALLEECGHRIRSLVDLGGGTGAWARAGLECGIEDVVVVEGEWVRRASRMVADRFFVFADAGSPLPLERRFDLALCLEVAEHLPAAKADALVQNLCRLSDVVLFSAAIPHQGGTDHVNEQWPGYWSEKFAEEGYGHHDIVRWRLWDDSRIGFWYRQNMLLYVSGRREGLRQRLNAWKVAQLFPSSPVAVVHPEKLLGMVNAKPSARHLLAALPEAVWRAVRWRAAALPGRLQGRIRR